MGLILMLADDDPDDVLIFKDLINEIFKEGSQKYNLYIVSDGMELMNALMTAPFLPHLLFLDINMPYKNGFDCLSEIKNIEKYKGMGIVMLSTSSYHAHVRMAYEKGADLYIVKSPDFEKMKRDIYTGIFLKPDFTRHGN